MRFLGLVSFPVAFCLVFPIAFGQQLQDIQSSFEFQDQDGRFFVGQCPGCAVFTNGIAMTVSDPQLAVSGNNAWMVPPGSTGVILFEVPARNVTFFFKDQTAAVQSVLKLLDPSGAVLQTLNGSTAGPDTNGFTRIQVSDSNVKAVTLQNNSATPTPAAFAVVDDFVASFTQTPALVVTDTFFFPRFADGTFEAAGMTNTFMTEAIFTNAGNFAQVQLDVFDDQGQPMSITLEDPETQNRTTDSSFTFELLPGASTTLTTVGLGDGTASRQLISGYWRVQVERLQGQQVATGGKVQGVAVFSRRQGDQGNEVLLFETGVGATRLQGSFSLSMDSTGDRDTGLALVNPPSVTTTPNHVTLEVWDQQFEQRIASATFDLAPGEAVSKFIWEYIQEFGQNVTPELIATLQDSRGLVKVTSDFVTAPIALRQFNPMGAFPQAVPTMTTFPVAPASAATE
jgi:hypothetical protein